MEELGTTCAHQRRLDSQAGRLCPSTSRLPRSFCLKAMFWAAPDTLMLEFLPKQRFGVMVWEEAGVMGARVWVLLVDSKDSQHTMEVDPGLVVPLLAKQLGAAVAAEEPRLFYRWNGVDLVHTR